jgi:hypothetical protein
MAWLIYDPESGTCGYPCEKCHDFCGRENLHPGNHEHFVRATNVYHVWRYATARDLSNWRPF